MNTIKSTKSIDDMTISELRAAGRATGQEPTETITLWDIDIAAALGVTIVPVIDSMGTELSHDEIDVGLSDKPAYGYLKVTRESDDSEWVIAHEPGWNEYEPATLRSTINDLSRAAEIAEWLNKGHLPKE